MSADGDDVSTASDDPVNHKCQVSNGAIIDGDFQCDTKDTEEPSHDLNVISPDSPLKPAILPEQLREDLQNACLKNRSVVPALQNLVELEETCRNLGINGYLKYRKPDTRRSNKRKLRASDNSRSTKAAKTIGSYEVEAILDCERDSERKMHYLVKWKDWDDEWNTWEPIEHLENCDDLLAEFHVVTSTRANSALYQHFIKLKIILNKVLEPDYDDMAVILKLAGCSLNEYRYSKSSLDAIKKIVKEKSKLLDGIDQKCGNLSIKRTLHTLKNKLKIDDKFGSLSGFVDFFEKRKELQPTLKKWEKELNQIITFDGEGVPIVIENLIDLEGPLPAFTYITKYYAMDERIPINDDPPLWCECENCFEQRDGCCPRKNDYHLAYTKTGVLRIEQQQQRPIFECNKRCKCPPDCPNRVIQRGRQHKLAIFRTDNGCGWGVKALEKIPKGSFVSEYVGEIITVEEADRRGREYDAEGRTYLFDLDYTDEEEKYIYVVDATKYGNIAHFINHACDSNLVTRVAWINNLDPFMPSIALFARRNIRANEELTFDYKMNEHIVVQSDQPTSEESADSSDQKTDGNDNDERVEKMIINGEPPMDQPKERVVRIQCRCGAANCRQWLY